MHNIALIEEVKAFRQRFGTTQTHLARLVGMTPQGWAKKEEGRSPFYGHQLAVVARHYNVPLQEAFPSYIPSEAERALAEELAGAA